MREVLLGARRKLQGLAFLLIVAFLVWLTIFIYNKGFSTTVPVTLDVTRIGLQLDIPADVNLNGVTVGQVRGAHSNGQYATLDIALNPKDVKFIPYNVQAEILPETLFGEKYVELVLPARPTAERVRPHEVLQRSPTSQIVETEDVFNNLLPLLQALQPAQLNYTLTALADALSGRGAELGQNLVLADTYFKSFNPNLGVFEHDITGLANLAANYAQAAPNLLALTRNFSINAHTLVQKQDSFATFLQGTAGFANTFQSILQQNEQNLISLANVSEPTLATLARYSPEFTCLLDGINKISTLIGSTFQALPGSTPALHISLQVIKQPNGGYVYPLDLPKDDLNAGPRCAGLPGAPPPGSNGYPPPPPGAAAHIASMGMDGSQADVQAVNDITAPLLGVTSSDVPNIADLLVGPVVRGQAVSFS